MFFFIILEPERKLLHVQFMLPMYRPYFKRTNSYSFKEDSDPYGPLMNPHESLNPVTGGKFLKSKIKFDNSQTFFKF